MKTTKLMLSALIAAAALVSCNKENHTPETTSLKSVSISLENAIMTKGTSTGAIQENTSVQVNDLNIYLLNSNGTQSYTASVIDADGNVTELDDLYFTASELTLGSAINLHFVDPAVTKVVVYANLGQSVEWANIGNNKTLAIGNEQNPTELTLTGSGVLEYDDKKTHTGLAGELNNSVTLLYKAEVTLTPKISRFEVDGFRIKFGDTPKYNEIKVVKVAFQNYYPATDAQTGIESGELVNDMDISSDSSVFGWFNDRNSENVAWYWDVVNTTHTPSAPVVAPDNTYSYHFFSCATIPVMVIDLLVDGRPAYVYADNYKDASKANITEIKEGMIYRMSAEGTVAGSNGYVEIPEEKIDPANHCLDITVTVQPWAVTLVQPEFGGK